MDRRVFLWLLVAVLFLGSCTSPACSSRLLLAADGDAEVWAAGAVTAAPGEVYGGGKRGAVRRSLGQRSSWPPSPVPNTPRASVAPGPPPRV